MSAPTTTAKPMSWPVISGILVSTVVSTVVMLWAAGDTTGWHYGVSIPFGLAFVGAQLFYSHRKALAAQNAPK